MEEKEEKKIDAEAIKTEATNTVNQVKETIKKVDFKKDGMETKGFVIDMFKDPLGKIQEIVSKGTAKYLTYAIIILLIWVAAVTISKCYTYSHIFKYTKIGSAIKEIILTGIAPIVSVLVMSIIIFVVNRKNKKPLTTIISATIVADLPIAIASVVSLLTIIGTKVSMITVPFAKLCNITSVILMYFALKAIFGEEKNSNFIKKFVAIEAIYYICYVVLTLLNIYI